MQPARLLLLPAFALAACGGNGWKGVAGGSTVTPKKGGTTTSPPAPSAAPKPLLEDTFVFVVDTDDGAEIHAYDLAANMRRRLFRVADSTAWDVASIALSPNRQTVAFASHYGYDPMQYPLADGLPTQSIWAVDVNGANLRRLMAPLPDDRGAIECTHDSTCEPLGLVCDAHVSRCRESARTRDVGELAWSPAGDAVWFVLADHHWQGARIAGGTTLGRVSAEGGAPELFAANDGCAQVTGPAPHPTDGSLVAVQSVCTSGGARVVRYESMPPRSGTALFTEADLEFSVDLSDVEWTRDGRGLVFGAYGGAFESDAIVYLEAATGTLYLAFEVAAGQWIEGQDLAPDGKRMVVCVGETVNGAARRDLYLVDLTRTTPTATPLTSDGKSCDPSW